MTPPAKEDARRTWLVLTGLLLVEFLVLDRLISWHHAWVYPRWNDQIQYLTEAYTGYEYLRAHGLWAGLWQTLVNPSAQGTLHDFFADIIFLFSGPSRSAALAVNLFYFLAWQAALFFAVIKTTRSRPLALAAVALVLACRAPWWGGVGTLVDFRLDWGACSAFGVALALALCTEGFRSTRWSLAFGAAVGFTLVTRFLTGAYFAPIFAVLLVWCLAGRDRGRRTSNLLLAALTAGVLAAPFFWLNREWVYNYYLIGHFTGPESAIRSPNMGVLRSTAWLLQTTWSWHIGAVGGVLVFSATVWLGIRADLNRRPPSAGPDSRPPDTAGWGMLGATFLLAPAMVLILHSQKSEPVLSILLPGTVVLVLGLWRWLAVRAATHAIPRGLGWGGVLVTGLLAVHALAAPERDPGFEASARKVNELADYIYQTQERDDMKDPRIGVDQVTDAFDAQIMRVICYERHRVWVPFMMTLPTGIMEEKPEVLFERLARSDFMFLTAQMPGDGHWPYDQEMRRLYPQLKSWCDQHLKPVDSFTVFDRQMLLYQRRDLK